MAERKYDSTVARIAGNIMAGLVGTPHFQHYDGVLNHQELVAVSVDLARQIVATLESSASGYGWIEEPVMPIPTTQVRQRRLAAIRQAIELGHVGGDEHTEWLLEDVGRLEVLLLQRAQEIAKLKEEVDQPKGDRFMLNAYGRQCWEAGHESALTARAQEIEQVKAELRELKSLRETETKVALGWADKLDAADAALVSRAPQPGKAE